MEFLTLSKTSEDSVQTAKSSISSFCFSRLALSLLIMNGIFNFSHLQVSRRLAQPLNNAIMYKYRLAPLLSAAMSQISF